MKALVLEAPGEPFVLKTVPDPVPGPGEAVARVLACGAGLTIQHARAGRQKIDYPRIIGHEITGVIEAVGEGVTNVRVGDPVAAYFYMTCGHCRWCRIDRETLCENFAGYIGRATDGGYAELMKAPAENFLKLPEGLDWQNQPAEVGVICDAIATPVKVVRRANITANDTVAVIGAGGGLGIHMVMLAKWAHARVIAVDVRPDKFAACRGAGADDCVDAAANDMTEALLDLTHGRGVDVVVDFVSVDATLTGGAAALGRGGRLLTLGGSSDGKATVPAAHLLSKEISAMGSRYATK
ncbi:MAG TPA: alcohol dehydrogenase catalytic domain-containing protein, partial [Afifellaceae bacterium]|nr:alcohol dehydrogenase catalytic domain-containing protein [Afifellaceae bacterium]